MKPMLNLTLVKGREPGTVNHQVLAVGVPMSVMDGQAPILVQVDKDKDEDKLKNLKCNIIFVVVLGIVFILSANIVTYYCSIYSGSQSSTTQVFRIVLNDETTGSKSIPLDITVDNAKQLEYSRSPLEGVDTPPSEILGLKDFKKGIFAYKEENGSQCYIGKIASNTKLHALRNGTVQEADVEQSELFKYLNYTIHPFVLRLAAGDNIVNFCGGRSAIWMIPMEEYEVKDEAKDENKHGRVRRYVKCKGWGCIGISHTRCFWNCKWIGERQKCTRRCVPK